MKHITDRRASNIIRNSRTSRSGCSTFLILIPNKPILTNSDRQVLVRYGQSRLTKGIPLVFNGSDEARLEDVSASLRSFIAERRLKPGDRIPAERHLMELLGTGRSAVRKALDRLERDGLIWRHVGKGTFVARAPLDTPADDIHSGIALQLTPHRLMRARMTFEPALAREAAGNASREALARIHAACARQRASASWTEYERQDDQIHRAIAEASDNALLLELFNSLNRVRRQVAMGSVERTSVRPPGDYSSFGEHESIAEAIEAHDPDAAFRAMRRHLQSVSSRLFEGL